jgi:hypothetical protein
MKTIAPKLGRAARKIDAGGPNGSSRTLKFSAYATDVENQPSYINWASAVEAWRALANKRIGDCTAVTVVHAVQCWLANEVDQQWTATTQQTIRFYSATSGYRKGHPSTDQGATLLSVMNHWRKKGLAGHKIEAYAEVDYATPQKLQQAIWLTGAVPVGVYLPLSVQASLAPGSVWDVPAGGATGNGAPGSWGGHAIPLLGYDATSGLYQFASWDATYWMTQAFVTAYMEEAYAPISSQDWTRTGYAPNGLNLAQIRADALAITQATKVATAA